MTRYLLALVLCFLLAACTQIPDTGPVEQVPASPQPRSVEIAPEPPQPGVRPGRLVEGFLLAMTEPEGDYSVAREFLTDEAVASWEPTSGARVYDGRLESVEDRVLLSGTSVGAVDTAGRFTSAVGELEHDFRVVQVDGQWRISNPPSGVLLSRYNFNRYYSHVSVYFMARNGGWVVPDPIHLPESQVTSARLVEAQLSGPSPSLAPITRNPLSVVAQDALLSASVDGEGVATLDFRDLPDELPDDRRREVGAQVIWTLTAIPRVTGLRITDQGSAWRIPGQNAEGVLEFSSQQGYQVLSRATTPDLFGILDSRPGRITDADAFLPFAPDGRLEDVDITDLAISLDGSRTALVDRARRVILTGGPEGPWTPQIPVLESLDDVAYSMGDLWVLGRLAGRETITRIAADGAQSSIDLTLVPGDVESLSVAQTGTHVALITRVDGERILGVATLDSGKVPAITGWTPLHLSTGLDEVLTDPVSVDWSAESQMSVLASVSGSRTVVQVAMDGSRVEDLGLVGADQAEEVTALPRVGGDAVVVRSTDGTVRRFEPRSRWTVVDVELQKVAYPG